VYGFEKFDLFPFQIQNTGLVCKSILNTLLTQKVNEEDVAFIGRELCRAASSNECARMAMALQVLKFADKHFVHLSASFKFEFYLTVACQAILLPNMTNLIPLYLKEYVAVWCNWICCITNSVFRAADVQEMTDDLDFQQALLVATALTLVRVPDIRSKMNQLLVDKAIAALQDKALNICSCLEYSIDKGFFSAYLLLFRYGNMC